jgi:hypothetical protein
MAALVAHRAGNENCAELLIEDSRTMSRLLVEARQGFRRRQ